MALFFIKFVLLDLSPACPLGSFCLPLNQWLAFRLYYLYDILVCPLQTIAGDITARCAFLVTIIRWVDIPCTIVRAGKSNHPQTHHTADTPNSSTFVILKNTFISKRKKYEGRKEQEKSTKKEVEKEGGGTASLYKLPSRTPRNIRRPNSMGEVIVYGFRAWYHTILWLIRSE